MRKLLKLIFTGLLGVIMCTSCDIASFFRKPKIEEEKIEEYHVFEMFGDFEVSELSTYLGIESSKTKAFTSKTELDAFEALISNAEEGMNTHYGPFNKSARFAKEVNFENQNVYVSASYLGHSDARYTVKDITKKGGVVTLNATVDIYTPAISPSECGLIYVVAEKGLTFENHFSSIEHYDPNLCYKPVLYLYNDEALDVEVKYLQDYRLKTTYPEYKDGWNVHINENGMLNINDSQREYYAIFFDEYRTHDATFEYGFNVSKDNAREFLENSLDTLGFTYREADEFIMFWLPILEDNENSLVYFEQTEERNEECPLSFSVTPDTVLRTIIHIKKVDAPQDITPQELETVNRVGFTVVEWGGTTY